MKTYILISMLIASFLMTAVSVRADNDNKQNKKAEKEIQKIEKTLGKLEKFEEQDDDDSKEERSGVLFSINNAGKVLIMQGEVGTLATSTPAIDTVKIWGLSLKIDMTNAKFTPNGTSYADLKTGDKVNIKGEMNSATGVVMASQVHNFSRLQPANENLFNRILKFIERLRELQQKAGLPLTPLPS